MTQFQIQYEGRLRTKITHQANSATIATDAPLDSHGKGECFSPTDLLAASLGSCILTVMAIHANILGVDLSGARASVDKIMTDSPRRVHKIQIHLYLPKVDPKMEKRLEKAAFDCPVHHSLNPDLYQEMTFHWGANL